MLRGVVGRVGGDDGQDMVDAAVELEQRVDAGKADVTEDGGASDGSEECGVSQVVPQVVWASQASKDAVASGLVVESACRGPSVGEGFEPCGGAKWG